MTPAAMDITGRRAAWLAALCAVLAAWGFGAALEGYSQSQHPLALLGARGVPRALAFNLAGFVVPGLLAATAAIALRARLPVEAGWTARIGARMLLLSGVAFAAQGLLPLDPGDLDGATSGRHATAWTLWWIAAAAGAAGVGIGLPRRPGWRALAGIALLTSALVAWFALAPPAGWPAGLAPRLGFGTWLGLLLASGAAGERR